MGSIVDNELRYTTNGKPILTVTLAARTERGSWYQRITMFGRMAERLADAGKGLVMHVAGRITQDKWETKDGEKRSAVKVIANNAHVVSETLAMEPDKKGQLLLVNGVHRVTLISNLVRDVEVRDAGSSRIAGCAVAWNENRKVGDEWESTPHYFDVAAWSDSSAFDGLLNRVKGDRVLVEGQLVTRNWEAQDGSRRWKTEVIASRAFGLLKGNQIAGVSKPALDIDADPDDMPF